MKNKISPTGREVLLEETDFIVSKTDRQGRLTYANRMFMRISGFKESELIGVQHNIVRHPDMPRSVFKLLWDTISSGQECFAYVKNLCKNGDHYWVMANVTPDYDQKGQIVGYFSVRRRPEEGAIRIIEPLYRDMLAAEQAVGSRDAIAAGTAVLMKHVLQRHKAYENFILGL
ncbi:MAG: PAS domain-containing protein [Pseudomonadota bacterium]